jgi:hypothetical protein
VASLTEMMAPALRLMAFRAVLMKLKLALLNSLCVTSGNFAFQIEVH